MSYPDWPPAEQYRLQHCEAFYASNDDWTSEIVQGLAEQQDTSNQAESAILMCGAAGLPYLLGVLSAKNLVYVDLYPPVLEYNRQRIGYLADGATSWEDTYAYGANMLPDGTFHNSQIFREYHAFKNAGALTDESFEKAKLAAAELQITAVAGDILETATSIAAHLERQDLQLSLANMTNVARYIVSAKRPYGYRPLAQVLQTMPRTDDFAVLSSGFGRAGSDMRLDDLDTYRELTS